MAFLVLNTDQDLQYIWGTLKAIATKGVASYAPIASNDGDAGRAKNRRVELVKQ